VARVPEITNWGVVLCGNFFHHTFCAREMLSHFPYWRFFFILPEDASALFFQGGICYYGFQDFVCFANLFRLCVVPGL